MKKLLRKALLSPRERAALAYAGTALRPLDETEPDDIFIAGYPKSGNTWFQDLVAAIVFGTQPERTLPRLIHDLVPDVHDEGVFYRRYQTPSYFKTHHLPRPAYRNVVYLVRDGRDAMVSYWHFLRTLEKREFSLLELVQRPDLFPAKWHDHVAAWLANPHGARIMIVRYEDLLSDPVRELERFCAFAGLDASQLDLPAIAASTSFQKLQAREQRLGESSEVWPRDKLFRRRGVAGSYQDEMPPEALRAFEAEAGAMLTRMGYPLASDPTARLPSA